MLSVGFRKEVWARKRGRSTHKGRAAVKLAFGGKQECGYGVKWSYASSRSASLLGATMACVCRDAVQVSSLLCLTKRQEAAYLNNRSVGTLALPPVHLDCSVIRIKVV